MLYPQIVVILKYQQPKFWRPEKATIWIGFDDSHRPPPSFVIAVRREGSVETPTINDAFTIRLSELKEGQSRYRMFNFECQGGRPIIGLGKGGWILIGKDEPIKPLNARGLPKESVSAPQIEVLKTILDFVKFS